MLEEIPDIDGDLHWLVQRLDDAQGVFANGGAHTRAGMMIALAGVIIVLKRNLPSLDCELDRQLQPMQNLLNSLHDLDKGISCVSLMPTVSRQSGSILSSDELDLQLMCFVAATLLQKSGQTKSASYKTVADKLNFHGFKSNRKRRDRKEKVISDVITTELVAGWLGKRKFKGSSLRVGEETIEDWAQRQCMMSLKYAERSKTPPNVSSAEYILDTVIPTIYGHLRSASHPSDTGID